MAGGVSGLPLGAREGWSEHAGIDITAILLNANGKRVS